MFASRIKHFQYQSHVQMLYISFLPGWSDVVFSTYFSLPLADASLFANALVILV